MATASKASKNGVASSDLEMGGRELTISAPNFQKVQFVIKGNAPYVQLAFGQKARNILRETHAAGSVSKKGKKREPKDFDSLYQEAQHISNEGWVGIPASAIRCAMIAACSIVGFHMTKGKKGVFIDADGFDRVEGTPLIKIKGDPRHVEHTCRNANGMPDIRVRAMFDPGWTATVTISFDADMFSATDVSNLLHRAGVQVGIGEGRPSSKNSAGMGWGTFEISNN